MLKVEPLLMSTLCVSFFFVLFLADDIFHLDVHYVCYTVLVQRFEPQGRRFTNFHYYYYHNMLSSLSVCCAPEGERLSVRQALTSPHKC